MVAVTRILFSFLGSLVSCCFEVESDGANESVEVVGDTLVEAIELGVRSRTRKRCGSSHVPKLRIVAQEIPAAGSRQRPPTTIIRYRGVTCIGHPVAVVIL
jgi:hypothetical protein